MEFKDRLKSVREAKDMTQAELANLIGISPNTLNSYENTNREPRLSLLVKIADALHVSTDYLLGRSTADFSLEDYGIKILEEDSEYIKVLLDTYFLYDKTDCNENNFAKPLTFKMKTELFDNFVEYVLNDGDFNIDNYAFFTRTTRIFDYLLTRINDISFDNPSEDITIYVNSLLNLNRRLELFESKQPTNIL